MQINEFKNIFAKDKNQKTQSLMKKIFTYLAAFAFMASSSVLSANAAEAQKLASTDDATDPIEGYWVFTLGDNYDGSEYGSNIQEIYEGRLLDETTVRFDCLNNNELALLADYDAETGLLTFTERNLGQTYSYWGIVDIIQMPFIYNWDNNGLDYQDITGQLDAKTGRITFGDGKETIAMMWGVWAIDPETSIYTQIDTIFLADLVNAKKGTLTFDDDSELWEDAGKALFMDGWLLPRFGYDQHDEANQYEVPVQRLKSNEFVYRLVNPYKYGPLAEINESTRDGYITFDITDPSTVLVNVDMLEAGFSNVAANITRFYCYNKYVSFDFQYNLGYNAISFIFPGLPRTTYKDGVVTLGKGTFKYGYGQGNTYDDIIYDANFGSQLFSLGGLAWTDYEGEIITTRPTDGKGTPMDMSASITLLDNGVENVLIDNNAPVEYYNLQGLKVTNPEKGNVYIRVRGNQADKVLF